MPLQPSFPILSLLTGLFPIWAILVCAVAFFFPGALNGFGGWIVPLLMLIMFGMGMTLTWQDFRRVLARPAVIGLGIGLQFLIMPLAALATALLLGLPKELAVGLLIVGCCPGGTASNVMCYLARADVALSISLTFTSTLLAVVLTPLLLELYAGATVPVPVISMLLDLVQIVFLPVIAGIVFNSCAGSRLQPVQALFPLISVAAIVLVIGIIVAVNRGRISENAPQALAAVMLHNVLGLGAGYAAATLLRLPRAVARTLAIEVGMQNSGLGVALALQYFSPLAALPGALFSIWHNLSGCVLAWWFRKDS